MTSEDRMLEKYINEFELQQVSESQKILFEMLRPHENYIANIGDAEGKILAYGLPLLKNIDTTQQETQAIIFAQDRQEVVKIFYILKSYTKMLGIDLLIINTGISMSDQIVRLRRKSHVIISTPIRLIEHMEMGTFDGSHVRSIIFDKINQESVESDFSKIHQSLQFFDKQETKPDIWTVCSETTFSLFQKIMDDMQYQYVSVLLKEDAPCGECIRYFYAVSNATNKVYVLTMIIEGLLIESKIAIIAKNKSQAKSLQQILLHQGFNAVLIEQNNEKIQHEHNPIYIISIDDIELLSQYQCTHVISFFASKSLKECHQKALYAASNKSGPILIEITNKADSIFISSLKQNTNIMVQKFILPSSYESRLIKLLRLKDYINILHNHIPSINIDDYSLIKEHFDNYSIDDLKKILVLLLQDKTTDISQTFVNIIEKPHILYGGIDQYLFKVTFYGPNIDQYNKETLLSYFFASKKITMNCIQKTVFIEGKIIFYIKDIAKEVIMEHLASNPLDGVLISCEHVFNQHNNSQHTSHQNNTMHYQRYEKQHNHNNNYKKYEQSSSLLSNAIKRPSRGPDARNNNSYSANNKNYGQGNFTTHIHKNNLQQNRFSNNRSTHTRGYDKNRFSENSFSLTNNNSSHAFNDNTLEQKNSSTRVGHNNKYKEKNQFIKHNGFTNFHDQETFARSHEYNNHYEEQE